MAGRRNKNKKKNKCEGKTQYEQRRGQEKENETEKEASLLQTDVTDNKENSDLEIAAERNEQIEDVLVKVSDPQDVTNSVFQNHLDQESGDEPVHPATPAVQSNLIKDEDAEDDDEENKVSDEFKKIDESEEVPDGDKADTNMTLHDKKISDDQLNPQEIKPEQPLQEDGTDKCMQNSLRDHNIEYLRGLFRPLVLEALQNIIPSRPQNATGLEKEPSQPVIDETNNIKEMKDQLQNKREQSDQPQNEKKATERLQNMKEPNDQFQDDKEPNDQRQYNQDPTEQLQNEQKAFDQLQKPKEVDVENNILSSPQNTKGLEKESLQSIADKSNSIREPNNQFQNEKTTTDQLKKMKKDDLQIVILSTPQNATRIEKEALQSVVDETNNNKEMKGQLQNKQEVNDQPQNEKKATERLQNTKEPNDQFQDDKEPNDQRQYKQDSTEQLQNEQKTFDQLQKPKEEDVQNIRLSSPKNTKCLKKEPSQSIADESNSIREPNNQFKNEETIIELLQKMKKDDLLSIIISSLQNATRLEKEALESIPDASNSVREPNNQFQNKERAIDQLKKTKKDDVQIVTLSNPQNATRFEKEALQSVADEKNNIKEMKDQLRNEQEPNDQSQTKKKATERLQNTKEPNDQRQYKQVPTEQLQNEKKTFDQIQKPKEVDVQNIIFSSSQNTKSLEKTSSQSIADKSNSIKEPNNQFQNEGKTIDQLKKMIKDDVQNIILSTPQEAARLVKEALQSITDESNCIRELNVQLQNLKLKNGEQPMRNDQLQESEEIKPIRFMHSQLLYYEALQIFVQFVVPELKQILQKKFSHCRRSSSALKSETKTSLVEDSQIPSNEPDVYSLLNPNIKMKTTDIPNFESTRLEEPDEVKGYDEEISIDLTEIQIEKSQVVEQQNREQQPFIEEELKEEVKRNDQVVEANGSIVKTNGSLDLVTTFGTTQGAEIKPLQEPLRFHAVHGDNIHLSKNNFRAQRKKKSNFFSKGIAFTSRPVAVGEKVSFHLRQLSSYWLGLLTIGFTTNDPISVADNLPTNVIIERDCADGFWAEHLDKKYYQESCRLHYYLNSSGNMCFGVNGVDKIEFLWNLETTKPVWALIDVFGYFTIVEFDIPKELRNTSFVESSLLSGRKKSGNSFNQSLDDNEISKHCLNYQTRFVPLDLYTQVEGNCIKFLEDRGVCVTSDGKRGCIEGKLPLFPGQTIVVQKLSVGKAPFIIGVKYNSPTTEVTSTLPEPVEINVYMHVKDELAITFTETGEIRVTKNLDVPKTILKVNRFQKLWPFVKIYKINETIKMWSSNTSSLAALQI